MSLSVAHSPTFKGVFCFDARHNRIGGAWGPSGPQMIGSDSRFLEFTVLRVRSRFMAAEASLRPPSAEPPARGSSIGRYVVLGLVGKGAMGEVYAAYDPELDRKVAVKLLRVRPGNGVSVSEGRTRTLREAQAIAKLSHPNVVVVFDVGTFRDEVFIAMEFVEGHTVSYWLQAQQRRWQEVVKVFVAAGRGLQAAHEKGLVHRDFKPDNVMVSADNQVRVMDFGLARQVAERGTTTERLPIVPLTSTSSSRLTP